MTHQPLTAAQAAQQRNRDASGQYKTKTHAEPGQVAVESRAEELPEFAPVADDARVFTTKADARAELEASLGDYAGDFDVDAMSDDLIEYVERTTITADGQTWGDGNRSGYVIREFADDADTGGSATFWQVASRYDRTLPAE